MRVKELIRGADQKAISIQQSAKKRSFTAEDAERAEEFNEKPLLRSCTLRESEIRIGRKPKRNNETLLYRFNYHSGFTGICTRSINSAGRGKEGLGLVSMRERSELVNGKLELTNASAGGALVRLSVPWQREAGNGSE